MSKNKPPIRHHFVPRFYLNYFANGNKLHVVNLSDHSTFIGSTKDIAVRKRFYDVRHETLSPEIYEKYLSAIENKASRLISRITNGNKPRDGRWPLSLKSRITLGTFLSLQALRGMDSRLFWDDRIHSGLFKLTSDEHVKVMNEGYPYMMHLLMNRPWHLVEFQQPSLITSDAPLRVFPNIEGYSEAFRNNGLHFNLSRKHALVIGDYYSQVKSLHSLLGVRFGAFDGWLMASPSVQNFANEMAYAGAYSQLYVHPDDKGVLAEILAKDRKTLDPRLDAEPLWL